MLCKLQLKRRLNKLFLLHQNGYMARKNHQKLKNEKNTISIQKISSDYTLSKILGEQIAEYYSTKNKINCTILRFGIVYGPRIKKYKYFCS